MAVFTIARQFAALGDEVAQELVKLTGYRLVDRESLEKRLGDFGIDADKRRKYDEKKPGLWASLSQERDDYLHYLKTAIFEEAGKGDCIIVGRGGSAILKSLRNLVSIRVVAPLSSRIRRVMEQYACNERHALQLIEQSDRDRSGFQKYFFSVDWADPSEYSLCVTMGDRPLPAEAVAIFDDYRRRVIGAEAEVEGRARIAELVLGQKVVTEIVYGRRLPLHFLEADVRGGRVILHGVSNTQTAIEAAIGAARSVPGVDEVESAIQVVQEFTVMP
ncbi:MAG TPA: cytidylate kinase family protein [Rectinemataceae bacterium]|nr:cytidylate kinase family protein [Rectinemataceae bacterium]